MAKGWWWTSRADIEQQAATLEGGELIFGSVSDEKWGGAGFAAIGYDIVAKGNFTVDLQTRFGLAKYRGDEEIATNVGLGVGFNWY